METKSYLIFSMNGVRYGIDAYLVQEIFLLPELTPIAEAPQDILGIINLRSKVLPVMHLELRLKHQFQSCNINDSVIVLKWEELQIGIIVNEVYEVKNIDFEVIESGISYGRVAEKNSGLIAGVAKMDADMIILLNHEELLSGSDMIEELFLEENTHERIGISSFEITNDDLSSLETEQLLTNFYDAYCPDATPEQKAIFRERADNLRLPIENSDFDGLMPLAVIGLNGEYFGLDLDVVREFTNVRTVTPIPCCPEHIVGNMNLRGEIVTLIDIRSILNIAPNAVKTGSKAIVMQADDIVVGLPVDEVFDVMHLQPANITSVPTAVPNQNNEFLRGTAPFLGKMLSIVDFQKIISKGILTVDESI